MCGIIGYIGKKSALDVLLSGLARLEYRGYDSAGVALQQDEAHVWRKKAGKLEALTTEISQHPLSSQPTTKTPNIGIGHTRWATHGKPIDINSHPHLSQDGTFALVHNGIIENFQPLKDKLQAAGFTFQSETDSEVVAHLLQATYDETQDLEQAVQQTLSQLQGAYAFLISHRPTQTLVAVRKTSPLLLGVGEEETFIASDATAVLEYTKDVIYLQDGDIAFVDAEHNILIQDTTGAAPTRPVERLEWNVAAAEKQGYEHYMLKEIHEQPTVVADTLSGRIVDGKVMLEFLSKNKKDKFANINRIVITAAGTALYAGMVGKYWLEQFARIPVEVDVASEYRYRNPVADAQTLCIVVSQSGETIDTLEALKEAQRQGAQTLGIINVKGSTIARAVENVLYLRGGPEISVASTKAYTGMLTVFALLALWFAERRQTLAPETATQLLAEFKELPQQLETNLKQTDTMENIRTIAQTFKHASDYLFLGRGINFPTALEGALKMKELSYIHAEAYATGEMKHGPIALIDSSLPVVVVATDSSLYEKTLANIQEIKARGGIVIALASEGDLNIANHADHIIYLPRVSEFLSPFVNAIALQYLAYETSASLGNDVDQPRNLAKSVTVE